MLCKREGFAVCILFMSDEKLAGTIALEESKMHTGRCPSQRSLQGHAPRRSLTLFLSFRIKFPRLQPKSAMPTCVHWGII